MIACSVENAQKKTRKNLVFFECGFEEVILHTLTVYRTTSVAIDSTIGNVSVESNAVVPTDCDA